MTSQTPQSVPRPARPDERTALEALQRRASLAVPAYREALLASPDAVALPAVRIDAGDVWVLEHDGGVAGFCVVIRHSADVAELDGLFVEPGFWRRGIGRALVAHAVALARRRGATTIEVIAGPEARSFYEAQGFVVTAEVPTRFAPALAMSRTLAAR